MSEVVQPDVTETAPIDVEQLDAILDSAAYGFHPLDEILYPARHLKDDIAPCENRADGRLADGRKV